MHPVPAFTVLGDIGVAVGHASNGLGAPVLRALGGMFLDGEVDRLHLQLSFKCILEYNTISTICQGLAMRVSVPFHRQPHGADIHHDGTVPAKHGRHLDRFRHLPAGGNLHHGGMLFRSQRGGHACGVDKPVGHVSTPVPWRGSRFSRTPRRREPRGTWRTRCPARYPSPC